MVYPRKAARNAEIIALRKEGNTLSEIAKEFGITRQRVYKILKTERRYAAEHEDAGRGPNGDKSADR